MTNYLLAGGGTAGHVNPLLALADAIKESNSENLVIALGTIEGIENKLVPARGYQLETVPRLPFPRRLDSYAFRFPFAFSAAVKATVAILLRYKIDVVVGFGGYASAPAYLAAKKIGIPVVVHEANALPGWANKLGAKFASAVGVAFRSTPLTNAQLVGMPLRHEIEEISRHPNQFEARKHFGLKLETVTLLVTGGSLGAKSINDTVVASKPLLLAAGIQVLHVSGSKSDLPDLVEPYYSRISYCDRMELAIAASDFAISRAGASTVSEFAAVGLPAVFVPYPVGNGEQKFNVQDVVEAGGALLVNDEDFTAEFVAEKLVPLLSNTKRLAEMSRGAKSVGVVDGTKNLLKLVQGVL